jgi:arginine/ornithine transport system permease protein
MASAHKNDKNAMNFTLIANQSGLFLVSILTTLKLVGISVLIGLVLVIPFAILRTSRNPLIKGPIWLFTYVFRGTPLLLQIYLIYYGLAQFPEIRNSFLWPFLSQAWWCALLAFTLNTTAYTVEILRGAILTMPRGELEAAKACGMTSSLQYRRIILPSAFRRALPAYGNEVIFMLHASALASTVTLMDILGAARKFNAMYNTYEGFLVAAPIYFCLTFSLVGIFRLIERRWLRHINPRTA